VSGFLLTTPGRRSGAGAFAGSPLPVRPNPSLQGCRPGPFSPSSMEPRPAEGLMTSGVPKKFRFFCPGGWYTHRMSLGEEARPFDSPDETRTHVKDSATRPRS
jgi:hypothetical protein